MAEQRHEQVERQKERTEAYKAKMKEWRQRQRQRRRGGAAAKLDQGGSAAASVQQMDQGKAGVAPAGGKQEAEKEA